ncbi:MAG: beta-ketoacyl synthase N-terminal-like domain-containing protein [Rhizomicrobium sp.]
MSRRWLAGVEESWSRLIASQSGARRLEGFETSDLATKIGCQVPRGDGSNGTFNPDQWMDPKEQRRVDEFIVMGMAAATQAVIDSGWVPKTEEDRDRTGVLMGSGIGGLNGIADAALLLQERGPRKISPFFIPGRLINLVSGYVSIKFGFKGPNHAVVTACATGAHAIGDAARLIAFDDADLMLAGGTEAAIGRLGIAGFNACRALSTAWNDTPEKASRPLR